MVLVSITIWANLVLVSVLDLNQNIVFGRTVPLGPTASAVPYTEIVLQPGLRPALYATYAYIKQGSIDYALK